MTDAQGGEAAVTEPTVTTTADRDYEAEAREQGWRPKEEWTGKPDNWKDAKTYVEHGDTAARLAKIEQRIEREVAERVSRIEKVNNATIARLTKIHEAEITSLKAERREAVKAGNVELVDKFDAEIEKRQEQAPLTDDKKSDQSDAEAAFAKEHDWYGKNRKMTAFARGISQDLASTNPNLSYEDIIKQVLVAVREEFPEYYEEKKPGANGHAPVDGGSENPGGASKATLFSKLPPEAKAQCARDVKAGHYKDNEAWAKVYLGTSV